MRSDGYVEDLFVNKTGQLVKAGEPLFRVYSPDIQLAQTDLIVAMGAQSRRSGGLGAQSIEGHAAAAQSRRAESRIHEVRETRRQSADDRLAVAGHRRR